MGEARLEGLMVGRLVEFSSTVHSFRGRKSHDVDILVLDYQSSIGRQNELDKGKEKHQSGGGYSEALS